MIAVTPGPGARCWAAIDRAVGGLAGDLGLYSLSAAFAAVTAATSTLAPHRAWGTVAAAGYAAAAFAVVVQMVARRRAAGSGLAGTPARAALTALTWATSALLPMLIQSAQRAAGRVDRAQEEVPVIENGAVRLLDHATPYLGHDALAALPGHDRLLGYLPYQPGMALFGMARAVFGVAWWTDARLWFAAVTGVALLLAAALLRGHGPHGDAVLVRAAQVVTVLPLSALALATGGDDVPVLALCLLALALCARSRYGLAGLAAGVAGALKLFAWPVTVLLVVHAVAARGGDPDRAGRWRRATRLALGAIGIPVAVLVPTVLADADAVAENALRFPLGRGLVSSPARSPFPGHLMATGLPGGRALTATLLVVAGFVIAAALVRRPPRTAASVALFCASGLLTAIMLMPSTRFGYLLYPVAFLAWAPTLAAAAATAAGAASGRSPVAARGLPDRPGVRSPRAGKPGP